MRRNEGMTMRRRVRGAFTCGVLVLSLGLVASILSVLPASAGQVLAATADAYVKSDVPDSNFGTTSPIRVDGSPTWNGYVKFTVPAGTVQSATLRLTASSTTSSATDIKAAGSSWTETGLTYNNAPAPGSTLGTISAVTADTTYSVDVTAGVTGGQDNSFAITTSSGTARTFYSKEAGTSTDPELEVVFVNTVDTVHTISQMEQDAVNGSFSTKGRFEGRHGGTAADPYIFDLDVKQVSGSSTGMNLVFREVSDIEFYQLDVEHSQVLLRQKIGWKGTGNMTNGSSSVTSVATTEGTLRVGEPVTGIGIPANTTISAVNGSTITLSQNATATGTGMTLTAVTMYTRDTGCSGTGGNGNSYHLRLELHGNLFKVYQGTESTPCADWTDSANLYPVGENASYYCMPGNYCTWEKVNARPSSITPSPLAWNFTGQDPGYYSAQTINGGGQSILESRFPYTVQNYRFGSSHNAGTSATLDHVEHAADGNVEYHLDEWSDFGTKIIYRATVGQYGYHVQFSDGSTTLKRKNLDGSTTTLATATSPSVPQNRHVKIVVEGTRHRLIDETDCNPTCTTYWDVTDSTYSKGNKTYWGNITVDGASLRGSFRALP